PIALSSIQSVTYLLHSPRDFANGETGVPPVCVFPLVMVMSRRITCARGPGNPAFYPQHRSLAQPPPGNGPRPPAHETASSQLGVREYPANGRRGSHRTPDCRPAPSPRRAWSLEPVAPARSRHDETTSRTQKRTAASVPKY